jgi:small subunit ribosomal protein S1
MELNKKNEVKKTEKNSKEEMNEMINQSLEKFKKIKRGDIIKGIFPRAKNHSFLKKKET